MTDHIEYFWQPSPQLWMAMRDNYCGCGECSRGGYGLGRTKEEAAADLIEKEGERG